LADFAGRIEFSADAADVNLSWYSNEL